MSPCGMPGTVTPRGNSVISLAEEDRGHRDEHERQRAGDGDDSADAEHGQEDVHHGIERHVERRLRERDVPVAPGHAEAPGERHAELEQQQPAGEHVRLPAGQRPEGHLPAEDQRQQVVRGAHEGDGRAAHHGGVEVPGDAQRVVGDDVDLFGAERDAGDAAEEAEDDHRQHQRREAGSPHGARRSQPNSPSV